MVAPKGTEMFTNDGVFKYGIRQVLLDWERLPVMPDARASSFPIRFKETMSVFIPIFIKNSGYEKNRHYFLSLHTADSSGMQS
jgi:hypothetical protein